MAGAVGPVTRAVWWCARHRRTRARARGKVLLIDDVPAPGPTNFANRHASMTTRWRATCRRAPTACCARSSTTRSARPGTSRRPSASSRRGLVPGLPHEPLHPDADLRGFDLGPRRGRRPDLPRGLYLLAGYRSPGWLSERFTADRLGGSRMAAWIQPNPPTRASAGATRAADACAPPCSATA